jgi:putative flippase GtrA
MMASAITTAVGYVLFFLIYMTTGSILAGEACARTVGTAINFLLMKKVVFRSGLRVIQTLPKFVFLVLSMGGISYALIRVIMTSLGWNVMVAKVCVELMLYLANFAVQREFVFGESTASLSAPRAESDTDHADQELRHAA